MTQNFELAWQSQLHQIWLNNGIPEFLSKIGVDFPKEFLQSLSVNRSPNNPYEESVWKLLPNSNIPQGVLHCYPKEVKDRKVIWEEWFLLDGKIRHHILSNLPLEGEEGEWRAEPGDSDHPQEVLNTTWHYRNSPDLRPVQLI